jgi:hypothetical protein
VAAAGAGGGDAGGKRGEFFGPAWCWGREPNKKLRAKNMKSDVMTITPEWAKYVLEEKNSGNRALNRQQVERLAKDMERGKWKLNGDPIRFSEKRLLDGQHRLSAVVLSGVTIQSVVIFGISDDVFDTIDTGKRRSAGDTLGTLGEQNACRLAAALMLIDSYMTGRVEKPVAHNNTEISDLLAKYPDVRESIKTPRPAKGLIQPSVVDACYYLFSRKDTVLADEFVDKILRGTGLEEGTAWYVLRERLVKNSLAKARLSRPYVMALCIKAWNKARAREKVRQLRWRENGDAVEPYPVIQ